MVFLGLLTNLNEAILKTSPTGPKWNGHKLSRKKGFENQHLVTNQRKQFRFCSKLIRRRAREIRQMLGKDQHNKCQVLLL